MRSFVLVPGAGGVAWTWHLVAESLERAGHTAIAVDLPGDDDRFGLDDYADKVAAAMGDRTDVVLVAQSLGGFTAPLVCKRKTPRALVLVNAMIPVPGETPGKWWGNTGSAQARTEAAKRDGYATDFDVATYFLHDMPPELARESAPHQRAQSERIFGDACDFESWPNIPIHVIAGKDDRFFPIAFQRRVARERLNRDVLELAGGHLIALSNPNGLAERLMTCANA